MRYYVRTNGVGAVALPMNTSLALLQSSQPSYSSVQLAAALQREQTRLSANEDPPIAGEVAAAGVSNVPGVGPAYATTAAPDVPMAAPMQVVQALQTHDAPGTIYMPLQIVQRSVWTDFWRFLGPPVIAATGLLVAVALLSRKRRKR
jgi:hypothetical protein